MKNKNEKISRHCGRGPAIQGFYKGKTASLNRLDPGSMSGMTTRKAFTLIELLVVVLIIGILAAIAVPQYQKAVIKSRIIQLQTFQKALATAQNSYYLANNTYPTEFSQLDISFDNWTAANTPPLGGTMASDLNKDVVRYNDLFQIKLSETGNSGLFLDGPYKGCGFGVNFQTGEWRCMEWHYHYKGDPGSFCQKIVGAGELLSDENNTRKYAM